MSASGGRGGAVAAALFITGAGQVLRGRLLRAAVLVAAEAAVVGTLVSAILAGRTDGILFLVGASLLVRLAGVVDAALGPDGRALPTALAALIVVLLAGIPIGGAVGVRATLLEAFRTPSGSMIPTLAPGDVFFIDKRPHEVRRGDVVVFPNPKSRQVDFVKRVVAVAGDTVELRGRDLYVNGKAAAHRPAPGDCSFEDDSMAPHRCVALEEELDGRRWRVVYEEPARDLPSEPVTVPPGQLFVVGDNRDNSHDSRHFGPVPIIEVKGRLISIFWPRAHARRAE